MKQQRILIITKVDVSSWKSCQHIVYNLIQSYKLLESNFHIDYLKIEEDFTYYQALKHASEIKESGPDFIIWADHKPCSAFMLNGLHKVYEGTQFEDKPKFIIHLFGDFILDCLSWQSALKSLNGYPVKLITASDAQKKLVDKMFESGTASTHVIPFPVNENFFNLNNQIENRNEIRLLTNTANDEIVILYTGRVSFQKNIDDLTLAFANISKFIDKKVHLWIAGPWDDIILPYLGMRGFPGSHFTHFKSGTKNLDISSIKFLGDLDSEKLIKVYHAADIFASFSTYNDEDYGMSAAEALMTGLPCVLSKWGGFSTFKKYSTAVDLISCKFIEVRHKVDGQIAQKKLLAKTIQFSNGDFDKNQIFEEASSSLSIKAVSNKLNTTFMDKNWNNNIVFTPLFEKVCELFKLSATSPFKNNLNIYREVYGDYYAD